MPKKALHLTPSLQAYIGHHTAPEPPLLQAMRAHVQTTPGGHMTTPWPTMHCLSFLVRLLKPGHIIEVGTFAGYSAVGFALATSDTLIHTIDRDLTPFHSAQPLWAQKPFAPRIHAHQGPGLATLASLQDRATFYYIDANKSEYEAYYHHIKTVAAPGAVMAFDNTLSEGHVLDTQPKPYVQAVQSFNEMVKKQGNSLLLPVGDGLTLVTV